MTQGLGPVSERSSGGHADDHASAFVTRLLENVAIQDWLITGYFAASFFALLLGKGPGRPSCIAWVLFEFACFACGIVLTRGGVLRPRSFANELVYRMTVFLSVFLSYFRLRQILPAVSPHTLDAQIFAFDMRVFGFEPSLSWDRFVTPHTTEWFAFFYFGYFFILSAHVIPMLLLPCDRKRFAHFALGVFIIFCVGHLGYMVVPGWGPYRYLEGRYEHALEGGLFWNLVKATVDAGGAQKDIFPSLHTAVPTFFAIYSWMHRRTLPFRYTWPLMAFLATQIILATMFLRWHYLIDIVAGLALATFAAVFSQRVAEWEDARRRNRGISAVFSRLEWRKPGSEG